ncbi:MAG: ABC transporter ATP-binding protein [Lentisphaeria bacterium]|nr:ABC transporter ATP-binding protein [Lentisphaeria bacterium]
MTCDPVLVCRGVTKRYGRHTALDRLDLELRRGEVVGLLGPNGAGKTTLIRMILGLGFPTAGAITVFGEDLFRRRRQILRQVGAVVEAPAFYDYLSGLENLRRLVALTAPVDEARLAEGLDAVGLTAAARRRVGTYSYGMKQRLGIAQALLPDTRLLILDEPANGLDPHGIAGIRRLIRQLAESKRMAVLVSSHLLGEIEQVCDRVAILHHGTCLAQAGVDEIRAREARLEVDVAATEAALRALADRSGATQLSLGGESGQGTLLYRPPGDVPGRVRVLAAAGADILRVQVHRETLEDVFLRLTRTEHDDVRIDAF